MSWSVSFKKPVEKCRVDTAIDELGDQLSVHPPAFDQFQAAKDIAKALAKSIPGPYINISLSGHANGVGWYKKDGMANDTISVSASQITEADLQYYK